MTVSTTPSRISYTEDGVSTVFPVPFRFLADADLVVERIALGVVTTLALTTDYTVSGADAAMGGSITRTAATTGAVLRIRRQTPRTQLMVYTVGDDFPAESHERALDRQMLISQEADGSGSESDGRAILAAPGEPGLSLPPRSTLLGGSSHLALMINPATGGIALLELDQQYKGDPGGNSMAVGLFTALSSISIPVGVDLVQTTGWSQRGTGAARYVYDATIDAAYVADNSRSAFISLNGRGFRLCENFIAVEMVGAIGDSATPDQAAITYALAKYRVAYALAGPYAVNATFLQPSFSHLIGSGKETGGLLITADVVGVMLQLRCFQSFLTVKVSGSVTHTHDLVQFGKLGVGAFYGDRCSLTTCHYEGAGNDNLALINGNLNRIIDCASVNAGRSVLRFRKGSTDNNGHLVLGLDARGGGDTSATGGSVCVEGGTSQSDSTTSRNNRIDYPEVQESQGNGIYVGSTGNTGAFYAENSDKALLGRLDFVFGPYAHGSKFEQMLSGSYSNLAGSAVELQVANADADFRIGYKTKIQFGSGPGVGWRVANDGLSGICDFEHTANGLFEFLLSGTGADQVVKLRNTEVISGTDHFRTYLQVDELITQLPVPEPHGGCTITWRIDGGSGQFVAGGTGNPEGNLPAVIGSVFFSTTLGLVIKQTGGGTTGWVNLVS